MKTKAIKTPSTLSIARAANKEARRLKEQEVGLSALHLEKEKEAAQEAKEKAGRIAAAKAAKAAQEKAERITIIATENEIKDSEEQTLFLSLKMTDGIPFSEYMGGDDKKTEDGKVKASLYNSAKDRVTRAIRRDTAIVRAQAVTSYAPNKGQK